MVVVVSLALVAVTVGLYVRSGFREEARCVEDARRARLVRAAEREMRRLGDGTR